MAPGPIRQKDGDYAAKPVDAGAAPKSAAATRSAGVRSAPSALPPGG